MGDLEITVDANDNVTGSIHWKKKSHDIIYRVSALWLTDKKTGDILLAQRKWTKPNDPGKWAESVAGTVEEGETYNSNIVKETSEEIGLTGLELKHGPKLFIDDGKNRFFCQWYIAIVDKDKTTISIQESEVEATKWVSEKWLLQDVRSNPKTYTPMLPTFIKAYYNRDD